MYFVIHFLQFARSGISIKNLLKEGVLIFIKKVTELQTAQVYQHDFVSLDFIFFYLSFEIKI